VGASWVRMLVACCHCRCRCNCQAAAAAATAKLLLLLLLARVAPLHVRALHAHAPGRARRLRCRCAWRGSSPSWSWGSSPLVCVCVWRVVCRPTCAPSACVWRASSMRYACQAVCRLRACAHPQPHARTHAQHKLLGCCEVCVLLTEPVLAGARDVVGGATTALTLTWLRDTLPARPLPAVRWGWLRRQAWSRAAAAQRAVVESGPADAAPRAVLMPPAACHHRQIAADRQQLCAQGLRAPGWDLLQHCMGAALAAAIAACMAPTADQTAPLR
jgi:hypothetical protein